MRAAHRSDSGQRAGVGQVQLPMDEIPAAYGSRVHVALS
jgi:hypothetical protein